MRIAVLLYPYLFHAFACRTVRVAEWAGHTTSWCVWEGSLTSGWDRWREWAFSPDASTCSCRMAGQRADDSASYGTNRLGLKPNGFHTYTTYSSTEYHGSCLLNITIKGAQLSRIGFRSDFQLVAKFFIVMTDRQVQIPHHSGNNTRRTLPQRRGQVDNWQKVQWVSVSSFAEFLAPHHVFTGAVQRVSGTAKFWSQRWEHGAWR